jgi:hypothetical protein
MNLNDLTLGMIEEMSDDIQKSLPPKLYYRIRKWLRAMRPGQPVQVQPKAVAQGLKNGIEQQQKSELAKNEARATVGDGGTLMFEFGANVPAAAREAALRWAKRKGLKAVEASLNKSAGAYGYALFSTTSARNLGTPTESISWFY